MIRNINKVTLIGNVGRKPELRKTSNDSLITDFNLAMTKQWRNQAGEEKFETTWVRVICWAGLAETVSKILNTGDLVYVEGRLSNRTIDKEDVKFTTLEVVADDVLIMRPSNPSVRETTEK